MTKMNLIWKGLILDYSFISVSSVDSGKELGVLLTGLQPLVCSASLPMQSMTTSIRKAPPNERCAPIHHLIKLRPAVLSTKIKWRHFLTEVSLHR